MKKIKIIYILICLVSLVCVFSEILPLNAGNKVGVFDDKRDPMTVNGLEGQQSVTRKAIQRVWVIIRTAINVLAVGAVIFAGIKYMIASADQKANIKKSLGILILGAVITFATTTIIDFVVRIAKGAL